MLLGAYKLIIIISSWQIEHFAIMKKKTPFLEILFALKSILSDMNIATLAFFWLTFVWYVFPSFFYSTFLSSFLVFLTFLCEEY